LSTIWVSHRGARIREISVDEAIEITEIRAAVEALVAARAAPAIRTEPTAP
jgi:DNA-binding GntR family transcriptional regulator